MSGGFFRGTSAEQDTRFSNKQAKLMKSQKFHSELDHLVDMTKVKMDVIKPWIAKRVTELLGFEDEVLINFIYGLLDKKHVNGKEVQIQLTGFMEKNTGKFMKELWVLLLSAQKNVSGVPQQFLDAKEEEAKKMKMEADRITTEIQKKKEKEKEGRELEREKLKKLDGEVDFSRTANAASDSTLKYSLPRASDGHPEDEKEADKRNGLRGKNRISISPHPAYHSPSSHRSTPSKSISKSFSNSRSYSDERHKSRSVSGSPKSRRRSVSPERRYKSPRRQPISPLRKHSPRWPRSPLRRGLPYSRRRSRSHSWHRSPSPARHRLPSPRRRSPSPMRRNRSPSPVRRRRSPSPVRHRRSLSPMRRRRSPSLVRHRSPSPVRRRRSPSPARRKSPLRRSSPIPARRRSPISFQRRSPPQRWRSPSLPWHRSRSPVRRRSPKLRRRSPMRSPRQRFRSRSPYGSPSPAYRNCKSLSRDHDIGTNGVESKRQRDDYASQRSQGKISPVHHSTDSEEVEHPGQTHEEKDSMSHRPPISLRSPQRDPRNQNNTHQKVPALLPTPEKSPSSAKSSPNTRKTIPSEDRKTSSPYGSPVRQRRERIAHGGRPNPQRLRERTTRHDSPEASEKEEISRAREIGDHRTDSSQKRYRLSPTVGNWERSPAKDCYKEYPTERLTDHLSSEAQGQRVNESKKKDRDRSETAVAMVVRPESPTRQKSPLLDETQYRTERPKGEISSEEFVRFKKHDRDYSSSGERLKRSYPREAHKAGKRKHSHSSNVEDSDPSQRTDVAHKLMKKVDHNDRIGSFDSRSEESDKDKHEVMEKRKHGRSDRHEDFADDGGSYDSQSNDKKEAMRRRKDEKRLRKEEKRQKREERRRRKEKRRARKLKLKTKDTETPPSDFEKNQDNVYDSDGELVARKHSHTSDTEETESEQKKLEIELRKKALESLRAKKGIYH